MYFLNRLNKCIFLVKKTTTSAWKEHSWGERNLVDIHFWCEVFEFFKIRYCIGSPFPETDYREQNKLGS